MKWDKTTKDKISYTVAVIAFLFGIALTTAGFIVAPLGIIDGSVLWVFAQCLLYSASIFGIGLYVNNQFTHIKRKLGITEEKDDE